MKSFVLGMVIFIFTLSPVYAGSYQTVTATGDIPGPRFGHTVVQINGMYYLFGGTDSIEIARGSSRGNPSLSDLYKFDPSSTTFTKLNPTTSPGSEPVPGMTGHNAVVHNNKIYVLNGVRSQDNNHSLYIYDPVYNTLTQSATPTYAPRSNAGVAVLDNVMYMVGGKLGDGTPTDQTWKFNFDTETFAQGSAIPWGGRWGSSVIAAKNSYNEPEVFVFGGMNEQGELSHTWQYSPEYNTWQQPAVSGTLPPPCASPAAFSLANCLYIAGGRGGSGYAREKASAVLNTAYYLDVNNPDKPFWTKIDLPADAPAHWQSAGYVKLAQEYGEPRIQIFTMGGLDAANAVIKLDAVTDYHTGSPYLPDALTLLRTLAGIGGLDLSAVPDIDNDGKKGLPEVIWLLQKAAGIL